MFVNALLTALSGRVREARNLAGSPDCGKACKKVILFHRFELRRNAKVAIETYAVLVEKDRLTSNVDIANKRFLRLLRDKVEIVLLRIQLAEQSNEAERQNQLKLKLKLAAGNM